MLDNLEKLCNLPGVSGDEEAVRFGFVIVDPRKRGRGYGKEMLRLGLKYAFEIYGAKQASLGVFENNRAAERCYRAAGFRDTAGEQTTLYPILGENWKCLELELLP